MATISEMIHSIGDQIRQLRIAAGIPQTELAAKANLGIATVRRLETGHDVSLSTLVAVVRVLDRAAWFDTLDPIGSEPSPIELLRLQEGMTSKPQRVSRFRKPQTTRRMS